MKKMKIDKWDALLIIEWYGCKDSEYGTNNEDRELADRIKKYKEHYFKENEKNE